MSSDRCLGDIAEIIMGQSPSGDTCNETGNGTPLLNGPTEFGGKHPYPVQFTTGAKKFSVPGDLLFCVRGSTTGRMNWGDQKYAIGRGLAAIRGRDGYPNSFVRAVIEANLEDLLAKATGSTFPNVSRDLISALPIPNITPESAKVIASIVEPLDDRITLLRETNATLEAIAQALFKSWFVDFDPVRAKTEGRAPEGMDEATAALFPDSFEETELGMVPRGWRVVSIGESVSVVDYVANGSFAALKENVTLRELPSYALYLRTTDFNSGFSGEFKYVDKSAYDFLAKSSLDGTEVIISNVGDVGTVFRPPTWLGLPMTLGSNAIAIKANGKSSFMYFYFSSSKGQHDIQSIVTGSAQLKFNKTNFRSLLITLPEMKVLSRFEDITGTLLSEINSNLAAIKIIATLRDTLLPRLISGQLQLSEVMDEN